jgi:hypothetical protein
MTRTVATASISAIVLSVAIAVAFLSGYAGWYHAMNTGVYVGSYGFEISGTYGPGFFHCDDSSCGSDL